MKHNELIDNIDGNTMAKALRQILNLQSDGATLINDEAHCIDQCRIATAYFSPEGFARIAKAISEIGSIKLMIGSDPIDDAERWKCKLDETEDRFIARRLRENLKKQEDTFRSERDHIPFTKDAASAVRQLVNSLRSGNMEVKRYEKSFLHAKAYIFSSSQNEISEKFNTAVIGSSNLTASGLSTNLELNLKSGDNTQVIKAKQWFDKLWENASPFDLASFFEEIFEPKTPFEIFLRVLLELYGEEINIDFETDNGLPLTTFQKHGVARALRLINETGGAIVADEVGLGKTFIAAEVLKVYKDRRQRALLICPAALRDTAWKRFQSDFEIYIETKSFEELAQDRQLWDENKRPNSNSDNLERNIEEYQLVIIDEAHNYRNPNSHTRADALRALLYGKRKDILLLTATPVNNSLWDLYHLTKYFLKQDSFLSNRGIISILGRFREAMRTNPNSLSPDLLYPIVDATTVKRTRQFIKKHYQDDQVKIDGIMQTIVFPEPRAISVRYELNNLMPGLFDLIEIYFNPEDAECLTFARYKPETYLKIPDPDSFGIEHAVTGLLLSGLLKRFESSTGAFKVTIERLIDAHQNFLKAMDEGFVVTTEFLKEATGTDDEDFKELLESSNEHTELDLYDETALREDVQADLEKLVEIYELLKKIKLFEDPKLKALSEQLVRIAKDAELESTSREDAINKRKVLIFSFFADTVRWINDYLNYEITQNEQLSDYKNRFEFVVGNSQAEGIDKAEAAARFAPKTAGKDGDPDETDILVTTDVLAEGVNLQQARHIINYDLPWNPMRLVQRHGRIDRIGSQHNRVFLRTIFPIDRLDDLLGLEEKISRKIAMAAASVGIVSPIANVPGSERDFTETRDEIEKLLEGDASLYERGGTEASTQTGEEYRHTLRKEMEKQGDGIKQIPWKAGSGMRKGKQQGIFYCAKVGSRTYLRFVHADKNWKVITNEQNIEANEISHPKPVVDEELGRCLRVIECSEDQPIVLDELIQDAAYDLWLVARKNIFDCWMYETDPENLNPKIRPLNQRVAEFIRTNISPNFDQTEINLALDILESPWERRDEGRLRQWFQTELNDHEKSSLLVKNILNSGLEPFVAPEPLPIITEDKIELLVWMAVTSD